MQAHHAPTTAHPPAFPCRGARPAHSSDMAFAHATRSKRLCKRPSCRTTGFPEEFRGDYCSEECKARHAGHQLLAKLVHDHRYCSTCFTQLKVVDYADAILSKQPGRYSRRTPESFIGYQYRTPEADTGEKERDAGPPPLIDTGTVCGTCGTTATNAWPTPDDLVSAEDAARGFIAALEREYPDDAKDVDAPTVVRVAAETGDLEYAVGRGVNA